MAAEQRGRKKLEKKTTSGAQVASNQKFYCCRCGAAFSRMKGNFPVSHSPMYRGIGYVPICNECVDEMYDGYRDTLGGDKEAMKRMCMKLDMYWNESIYVMVERSAGVNSRVRNYIGKTNMIRYVDKTYDNTIKEEALEIINTPREVPPSSIDVQPPEEVEERIVDPEVIEFWGRGYDADFYDDLAKRYEKWTKGLGELTTVQESLYKQVCLNELIIARNSARGDAADKATKNLMDALGSLNIKPSQNKNDALDAELDKMPLGVGIQTWEFARPLPETPDELKDKSGVIKDITTWFLGHACKMVGLRNSYCKMYEDAMDELRVKRPEFADEDDDTMLADIFGPASSGGDDE